MAEFRLNIAMVDDYNGRANRSVSIEAADYATAGTIASDFINDYQDVTGLRILWYTVSAKQVWFGDTPDPGSVRDVGMTFSMRKTDNELAPLKVPAPVSGIINADGTLNLTHSAVTALMANFLSGAVRVSDHEQVTELVSGRLDK